MRPKKLRDILAYQRECRHKCLRPTNVCMPTHRSKAAQNGYAKRQIQSRNHPESAVAINFGFPPGGLAVRAIEVLINGGEDSEAHGLLLRKQSQSKAGAHENTAGSPFLGRQGVQPQEKNKRGE